MKNQSLRAICGLESTRKGAASFNFHGMIGLDIVEPLAVSCKIMLGFSSRVDAVGEGLAGLVFQGPPLTHLGIIMMKEGMVYLD